MKGSNYGYEYLAPNISLVWSQHEVCSDIPQESSSSPLVSFAEGPPHPLRKLNIASKDLHPPTITLRLQAYFVTLPSEILHFIFELLTDCEQLCLALTSTRLWQFYLSTTPKIPSSWTNTCWKSPSALSTRTLPLGALLADWMGPQYREIRPDPTLANDEIIVWLPHEMSRLPPFFIHKSSLDTSVDEGDLFLRYKIYHASVAIRKPFLLPHPRNRGKTWWTEAKMAIVDDLEHFRNQESWEKYWRKFGWYDLRAKDRCTAVELVEGAIKELARVP